MINMDKIVGDESIEEQHRQIMEGMGAYLDEVLNGNKKGAERTIGFVLLVFPFSNAEGSDLGGRCNYICNGARREDIVVLFKEQIAYFQGQAEQVAGHA